MSYAARSVGLMPVKIVSLYVYSFFGRHPKASWPDSFIVISFGLDDTFQKPLKVLQESHTDAFCHSTATEDFTTSELRSSSNSARKIHDIGNTNIEFFCCKALWNKTNCTCNGTYCPPCKSRLLPEVQTRWPQVPCPTCATIRSTIRTAPVGSWLEKRPDCSSGPPRMVTTKRHYVEGGLGRSCPWNWGCKLAVIHCWESSITHCTKVSNNLYFHAWSRSRVMCYS